MNDKEKLIAASMLKELSSKLGNECCNDWSFPASWSEDEKITFVKEYHDWNGDPEEFLETHLHLPDFCVASFLAHKLRND